VASRSQELECTGAQRGSAASTCGKPLAFRPDSRLSFLSVQAGRLSLPACTEEVLQDARLAERQSLSASQAAEPQETAYGALECGSLLPLFRREPARGSAVQARPASRPEQKRQQATALQEARPREIVVDSNGRAATPGGREPGVRLEGQKHEDDQKPCRGTKRASPR
jgi:hypothetical protein